MKLEFINLCKNFGSKEVLKGLFFTAESGKGTAILGRNGAGKTTTIRILLGLFEADSGEILLDGQPIHLGDVKVGYLPEERGLYPKKKILEQLVYFAQLKGLSAKEAKDRCLKWLEKLELAEYKNKRLDTLSKGNQQKVQLITALVHDPDIVILDEPFSGLDPVNALTLETVVKDEIKNGKVVLFSGHQMNYIEEFCDNIAVLNKGKIVLEGNLAKIKRNYPRNLLVIKSPDAEQILADYTECRKGEQDELLFTLENENDKKSVMEKLTASYDIDEMRVYEPTLADIFVEYTKQEAAA